MGINFKDALSEVAKIAPTVATALGGAGAGAVASMVTNLLGIDATNPADLVAATRNPEMVAKLKQLDQEHEREMLSIHLQAETQQMQSVNETMRAELQAEGFWRTGWRPYIGWVMGTCFLLIAIALCWIVVQDPSMLNEVMATMMTLIGAMAAVQGINIRSRSNEHIAKRTGVRPPTLLESIRTKK